MIDIFEMLNNDTHKNAESALLLNYSENSLYTGQNIRDPPFGATANIVSRDYDQIGLLVKHRLLPKGKYFEMFGKMTVLYHHILFMDIDNRRKARGEPDLRIYFTKLAIDGYEYWKKRNRLPFDPLTGQSIPQTALEQWKESLPK